MGFVSVKKLFGKLYWAIILLVGCATPGDYGQREVAQPRLPTKEEIDLYLDCSARVRNVGRRLFEGIDKEDQLNRKVYTLPFYHAPLRDSFKKIYGIPAPSSGLIVVDLMNPDEVPLSDVRRGDEIVKVQDTKIRSQRDFEIVLGSLASGNEEVKIRFRRGNYEWEEYFPLVVQPRMSMFAVDRTHPKIAAATDGKSTIIVSMPLTELTANDHELAFVLAHELAHINLNHYEGRERMKTAQTVVSSAVAALVAGLLSDSLSDIQRYSPYDLNRSIGAVAGEATGQLATSPFSKSQERNADKVAVEYLKKAGFDPVLGIEILARLARKLGDGQGFSFTHPAPSDRYADLYEELTGSKPDRSEEGPTSKHVREESLNALRWVEEEIIDMTRPLWPVDHQKLGIERIGLAASVNNLWVGAKVEGESETFDLDTHTLFWFAKMRRDRLYSANMLMAAYRIEWYLPSGRLYAYDRFKHAYGNMYLLKSTVEIENMPKKELVGEWRVRVWRGDEIFDDRFFTMSLKREKESEASTGSLATPGSGTGRRPEGRG